MIAQDPSDKVRDKATFGLSVSKAPIALTTLIAAAQDDKSTKVRGQALFWLAQKAGKDALAAITDAIDKDPGDRGEEEGGVRAQPAAEGRRRAEADGGRAHQPQSRGAQAGDVLARPVERSARGEVLRGDPDASE